MDSGFFAQCFQLLEFQGPVMISCNRLSKGKRVMTYNKIDNKRSL